MADTEQAWAAGFFDGEGTFGAYGRLAKPRVEISQLHPDTLERFRHAVGNVGNIVGPYDRRGSMIYVWRTERADGFAAVTATIASYLADMKRAQCQRAIDAWTATRTHHVDLPAPLVLDELTGPAWAAGFFDAEGTWTAFRRRDTSTGTSVIHASIGQADAAVLHRFQAITSLGRVAGPYRGGVHRYQLTRFADVHALAAQLWPYLHVHKRAQYEAARILWAAHRPLTAVA